MSDALAAALEKQEKIGGEVAAQGSLTALVQTHALSIMQQPKPDFSRIDNEKVRSFQGTVQGALNKAADNAGKYLWTVQPESIALLAKVENYFVTLGAFSETLKDEEDPDAMVQMLRFLREQAGEFTDETRRVASGTDRMVTAFSDDKRGFTECAVEINTLVSGENGILEDLRRDLENVNEKITAASVGAVVSGSAILTGAAFIVIGCCTSIFTGGLSLGVAIGGGVLILGGLAGGIGSGIALANLYDEKKELLAKQERLESGVKLLTACSAGLADLGAQAGGVATALQNTANSWTILRESLNSAADNIEKAGRAQSDFVRKSFLRTIERSLPRNLEQLRNTRNALIGMKTVSQPNTHTGDLIRFELQKPPRLAR
ncbi:alpha-helical pore-forming toxin family protein [Streptomyces sp. NBC_01178]|uniref:HBL/NHE enterotoxin family protein n=1 Tax=Streptomyces sp. NBC_01178 TaxID=2903762 RepID=UPI0038689295|nr:alpha-helical pore-forming toxin family protein [Streptomyces sp. NBC_01178]